MLHKINYIDHMKTSTIVLDQAKPTAFLSACPVYKPTPLYKELIHDKPIWIKDEGQRMRLGAFKALGGVYAVAQLIAQKTEMVLDVNKFLSDEVKHIAKKMTFVCASAGNHGLAVAAGAKLFGASSRIHLAATVPEDFANRLREKNAEVVRSGEDYEASIQAAILDADTNGAVHLADGSWPGYIEPPRLVMEGYTVLAEELRHNFEMSNDWPSHVYLQAGVGGFAGAIAYMIRKNWSVQPKIIVVEPEAAPCLKHSVHRGKILTVDGPVSEMGRLDCKTPSLLAFDILSSAADEYVLISEDQAEDAVQAAKKLNYNTSPSGAAGLAAFLASSEPNPAPLIIITENAIP